MRDELYAAKRRELGADAIEAYRARYAQECPSQTALLLISDRLRDSEQLIDAALPSTRVISVSYDLWSLGDLQAAIARGGPSTYERIGVIDHGHARELRLLRRSCPGGQLMLSRDLAPARDQPRAKSLRGFFVWLAGRIDSDGSIDLLSCTDAPALPALEELTGVRWSTASEGATAADNNKQLTIDTDGLDCAAAHYFHLGQLAGWNSAIPPPVEAIQR